MKHSIKLRIIICSAVAALCLSFLSGCMTLGERKPIATVLFSNGKEARIRLYPDKAPNTVKNFIQLANSGFYDGSPIHRIEEYFVIQTGQSADGSPNPGYNIKGEFPNNNYSKNDLLHEPGVVSMARTVGPQGSEREYYDTAGSQWFITLTYQAKLDGDYAPFGKVISGMADVQQISKMDVDENKVPRDEIYIVSVRVDTFGKDYGAPATLPLPNPSGD